MAKLCALLVLALACAVRAVRFDPPSAVRTGKYFADDVIPRTKIDDPICRPGDGIYAHPTECTKYVACAAGISQERECPEGFKFDSRRYCTMSPDADCGRSQDVVVAYNRRVSDHPVCPESYGYFPFPQDCHKFVVCVDAMGTVRTCPEGQHYLDNVGCADGDECPRQESEDSEVCRKADGVYPHSNCLKYYKCVNFKPQAKGCPRGKAFDKRKGTCTREQFNHCKRNDMQDIMRDD